MFNIEADCPARDKNLAQMTEKNTTSYKCMNTY